MGTRPLQPLLNGPVDSGSLEAEQGKLHDELLSLRKRNAELFTANGRLNAKIDAYERVFQNFRLALGPLYNVMRALFGDMDALDLPAPGGVNASPRGAAPASAGTYEAVKRSVSPNANKVIDVMVLAGGPMTRDALRAQVACGWSALDASLKTLRELHVIEKSGDRWQLKPR